MFILLFCAGPVLCVPVLTAFSEANETENVEDCQEELIQDEQEQQFSNKAEAAERLAFGIPESSRVNHRTDFVVRGHRLPNGLAAPLRI